MLKTHPQLASLGQKPPTGAGDPGEDSPLLIIPAARKPGTPEVMESEGGTKQQIAEGRGSSWGSRQLTAT